MSAGLHSKWNRTLTWMLSAALIAQGGTVVYAGDLGDEAAVEAFSEDNYEADDVASDLEFSGDEETVIEDSTDESTENIAAETSEGDEQTDADADFQSEADFTSEVQVEEETSIADGLYLGDIPADNSIGQIIDGNVVFNGVSEETSLFVPVYGEKGGSKIAVRDMTWESSDESVVSIFDTDSDDQLQLRSHKAGGAVVTELTSQQMRMELYPASQ